MSKFEGWIAEITTIGYLAISGPDAERFLQSQLTCDLAEVTSLQSRLALYCTQKGRVLAAGRLFLTKGRYLFQLPACLLEETERVMKRYALFSKVAIEVVPDLVTLAISDVVWPGFDGIADCPRQHNEVAEGKTSWIVALAVEPRPLFQWIGPKVLSDSHWSTQDRLQRFPSERWTQWEIQEGIPSIVLKTSEQFLPHQLDFHRLGAVSWTKGCYIGQEVIARIEYRGAVKQHLYRLTLPDSVFSQPGDSLVDASNNVVGTILMAHHETALAVLNEHLTTPVYYPSALENPILSIERIYE